MNRCGTSPDPGVGATTSRRGVLLRFGRALVVSCLASALLWPAAADDSGSTSDARRLRMFHTHTNETIDVVYFRDGAYVADALERIDHILRDHRSGKVHEIDPKVLDFLWQLAHDVGNPDGVYEIISGYRSPETNETLRSQGGGQARRSQHLLGKAIDVRLRGSDTAKLRDAALALQRGGVGYYEKSDFVHVDTGRVRRW